MFLFFFFKQKTADEMRISDWSSDVCSSDLERMTLTLTAAYGMEGVALRLWNVYGPGQALSNPYTGVLAIFASRLASGHSPLVFEDGRQQRDFVQVRDVARAFAQALEQPAAAGGVFNIASGQPRTIASVARDIRSEEHTGVVQGKGVEVRVEL